MTDIALKLLENKTCENCRNKHFFFSDCPKVKVLMNYISLPKFNTCKFWIIDDSKFVTIND